MKQKTFKIIISGPESTGKTTLAGNLARHYGTIWIPEYARTYVANLNREYSYDDVVKIAEQQIFELNNLPEKAKKLVFFDTGLIITKIWFKEVYNKIPEWLDNEIIKNKPDLYLLCYYDLSWEYDTVRENGSLERRAYLFDQYKSEIERIGVNCQIIKGLNQDREKLAIEIIDRFIKENEG